MAAFGLLAALLLGWTSGILITRATPVFVTASFLDKGTRLYVEDLKREEVRVKENGQPREVEFFAGEEVPVAYGLLFDRSLLPLPDDEPTGFPVAITSGMAALNAAHQIVDMALSRQVGWVATYDKAMRLELDWSADGGRIKDAVERLRGRRSFEESSLYASLFEAVRKLNERQEKRRVLILFLAALDMETGGKLKPLRNLLAGSNVEFFVAGFSTRGGPGYGMPQLQSEASLRELAGASAGDAFFSYTEGIEGMGRRISNQIRTFYTIGFQAESDSAAPGRLVIECSRPGVRVKARPTVPTLR